MLSCVFNRARAVSTFSTHWQWSLLQGREGRPRRPALAGLALPWNGTSFLQSALTKNRARNSFRMRSYKLLDLKSPGMNSYKKYRGVGPLRSLQRLDLVRIFHPEGRIKASSSVQVPFSSSVSAYVISSLPGSRPRPAQDDTASPREQDLATSPPKINTYRKYWGVRHLLFLPAPKQVLACVPPTPAHDARPSAQQRKGVILGAYRDESKISDAHEDS